MYKDLLEWFLDILENDGHDIREVKGMLHMAINILNSRRYEFEKAEVVKALLGKESEDAE